MTRRDKIGLGVLIAVLGALMGSLAWSLWNTGKPTHDLSHSVVVKQRLINLQKSK